MTLSKTFYSPFWLYVLFFILLMINILTPINLATADLGRHLANGREILTNGLVSQVLTTNFYSYTHPDFAVINHHWLYGVASFSFWQIFGFNGLSWLNVLQILMATLIVLKVAKNFTKDKWVLLASFLVLPLLASRVEIRPESFSLLMTACWIWAGFKFLSESKFWPLFMVVGAQMIWVNTHIFFVFSFLFLILISIEVMLHYKKSFHHNLSKEFLILLGFFSGVFFFSLVSPFGMKIYDVFLHLLNNYNYKVAENQSPIFLINYGINSYLHVYAILFIVLLVIALIFLLWKKSFNKGVVFFSLMVIFFAVLSSQLVRVYPFLALSSLPLLAVFFQQIAQEKYFQSKLNILKDSFWTQFFITAVLSIFIVIMLFSGLWLPKAPIGWGLKKNNLQAEEFLQVLKPDGRVFNNYDVGGFLIWHLPLDSIFVDNRPEAYPNEFFDLYRQAQTDWEMFTQLQKQYNFSTVIYYYHDLTPEAQTFLKNIVQAEVWSPVYGDSELVIFLHNSPENQAKIDRFKLDRAIFNFSPIP